jgi:uncharacterized membrane protein YbhN (UPF0104 family)
MLEKVGHSGSRQALRAVPPGDRKLRQERRMASFQAAIRPPRSVRRFAQALIAVLAIAWVIASGKLDFQLLSQHLGWHILLPWGGLYLLVQVTQTLRWWLFAKGMGIPLTLGSASRQMGIGMFWGLFTPALVGVDVSRAVTMNREFPGLTGPTMLSILADRLMLMVATLLLSAFALPLAWPLAIRHPALMTMTLGAAAAGLALFAAMLGMIYAPVERWSWSKRWISGRLANTYAALRHFRDRPGLLLAGLGLGLLGQSLGIGLVGMLMVHGWGDSVSWPDLMLVVPIGWHAMSLPVAPAGVGVGQVAFEQLFVWAGCAAGIGATVITTYQICLAAVHLAAGATLFLPGQAAETAG